MKRELLSGLVEDLTEGHAFVGELLKRKQRGAVDVANKANARPLALRAALKRACWVLREVDDRTRLDGDLPRLIQGLQSARLDRLARQDREVVQEALAWLQAVERLRRYTNELDQLVDELLKDTDV